MAQRLEFSDQFLVGIKQIDREHRRLFQIIGNIHEALERDEDQALQAARTAVAELLEYTNTHFASEESLMARYAYPELAAHQVMHAELLGQVNDMEMRIEFEGAAAAIELSRFLGAWLSDHIQQSDKRFGAFVAETEEPGAGA